LNRSSVGDVLLHNTAVKIGNGFRIAAAADFTFARNNLCIGGPSGGQRFGGYSAGRDHAASVVSAGPHCSYDYDAIGTFETPFAGSIGQQRFASLEELRRGPNEAHGVRVDMNVFDRVAFPIPPVPERPTVDLRPRAGTAVVDAALRLPNINDDFRGAGPDIGAYEAGEPLPRYGPRPRGIDEETPRRR
jgi:hypothetical protein